MSSQRSELQSRLSLPCLISGEIADWRQNDPKNDLAVCLSNCQLEGYDWVELTDHMWFFVGLDLWRRKKNNFGGLKGGRSIAYLGRVAVYRRSNGSYDLGVRHDPALVRLSLYLQNRLKMSLEHRAKLHNSKLIVNDFIIDRNQNLDYYRHLIDKDKEEVEQGLAKISVGHGVDRDQLNLQVATIKRTSARGFKND